jgi:hypothetical protein
MYIGVAGLVALAMLVGAMLWGPTSLKAGLGSTTDQPNSSAAGLPESTSSPYTTEPTTTAPTTTPITTAPTRGPVVPPPDPGPTVVRVPNVVGKSFEEAQNVLQDAGFTVNRTDVHTAGAPDTVVRTNPAAGAEAEAGSEVTVSVNLGTPGGQVPDVVGQSLTDASSALHAAGFTRINAPKQTVTDPSQDGKVLAQSPSAGQSVPTNTLVSLTVGELACSGGGGTPGGGGSGVPSPPPGCGGN